MSKHRSLYERVHGTKPSARNVEDLAEEAWTTRQESAFGEERETFRNSFKRPVRVGEGTVVRLHRPRRVVR